MIGGCEGIGDVNETEEENVNKETSFPFFSSAEDDRVVAAVGGGQLSSGFF